jgi:hypothetical protein
MSLAYTAVAVSAYGAYSGNKNSKEAASAAKQGAATQASAETQAAEIAAQSQREALDYMKEVNALPTQYRDQALAGLASHYQTPGAPKTQQQLIDETYASPLYKGLLSTTDAAVDQMARYQSATGGLRSGNAQAAFAREGQRVSWDAFNQAYNQAQSNDRYERGVNLQGLAGLAGLDTGSASIANMMAGIGQTQAQGVLGAGTANSQGQIAAGQIRQQGAQNNMNNMMGLAGLGLQAYNSGLFI